MDIKVIVLRQTSVTHTHYCWQLAQVQKDMFLAWWNTFTVKKAVLFYFTLLHLDKKCLFLGRREEENNPFYTKLFNLFTIFERCSSVGAVRCCENENRSPLDLLYVLLHSQLLQGYYMRISLIIMRPGTGFKTYQGKGTLDFYLGLTSNGLLQ